LSDEASNLHFVFVCKRCITIIIVLIARFSKRVYSEEFQLRLFCSETLSLKLWLHATNKMSAFKRKQDKTALLLHLLSINSILPPLRWCLCRAPASGLLQQVRYTSIGRGDASLGERAVCAGQAPPCVMHAARAAAAATAVTDSRIKYGRTDQLK
jgi:hypothetical protein